MNTVVLVLMLLTAFNFLLKQTFWKVIAVCVIAAICAAFAGLMWPYAIEQSKTQIANWLSNQPLMLDTAVLLSVEVCVQMAYAMLAVHVANDYPVKPRMIVMYRFLRKVKNSSAALTRTLSTEPAMSVSISEMSTT